MNEWIMLMAEGAGVGAFAGLAWARWARREWVESEKGTLRIFSIAGAICTAVFLVYVYTDTPDGRNNKDDLGILGPFFLVGTGVAWFAKPFLRKPQRRRPSSGEQET